MAADTIKIKGQHNESDKILMLSPFIDNIYDISNPEASSLCTPPEGSDFIAEKIHIIFENEELNTSISVDNISKPVQCHICDKIYKNKRSLATHMRVIHRTTLTVRAKMPCLEVNCDFRGSRIANLISHLVRAHKRKFQCEKVTFQHEEQFWKWKKKAEDACRSTYTATTAAKEMVFGDKKLFLRCNRSGYARTHKRTNMNKSSAVKCNMKINAVCTSFMNVSFPKEGGASVIFCKTHYGHKQDVMYRYSRLTDYERNMIKAMIADGVTASEIISVMKTQIPEHRHHLLKYSNIRNISAKQNLLVNKEKRSVEDYSEIKSETSLPYGSCDFLMDLKVENEVEIETGIEVAEVSYTMHDAQSCGSEDLPDTECSTLIKLRSDILDKAQQISHLAVRIMSKEALSSLNERLSDILKDTEDPGFIELEVLSDTVESFENYDESNGL